MNLKMTKFLLLFGLLQIKILNAQSQTTPILKIEISSPRGSLFIGESTEDSRIIKKYGQDDSAIRRNIDDLKEVKGKQKPEQKLNAAKKQLDMNLALSYIYQQKIIGKIKSEHSDSHIQSELNETYKNIISSAKLVASLSKKDSADKARADFFISLTQIKQGLGAKAIGNLKNSLKNNKLDSHLKKIGLFVVSLSEVESRNNKSVNNLINSASSLNHTAKISANLAAAKLFAGLNNSGSKAGKTDKRYQNYLKSASNLTGSLSAEQQQKVLKHALGIWRGAEGSGDWTPVPFSVPGFNNSHEFYAIIERHALFSWSKKDETKAISTYRSLLNKKISEEEKARIDMRILAFEGQVYNKTNDPNSYQKAILSTINKYKTTDAGNDKSQEVISDAINRHHALVRNEIKISSSPKTTEQRRNISIGLAYKYLEQEYETTNKAEILNKIGDLQVQNKQHAKAVAVYLQAASLAQPEQKESLIQKALKNQSLLAEWSYPSPNWGEQKAGAPQHREKLLAIYQQNDSKENVNWIYTSQMGLLKLALNKQAEAFALWKKALEASPQGENASQAAGYMLTEYQKTSRWQELETFAKFCQSKGIIPKKLKTPLDLTAIIAESLYQGGKLALANKNFPEAVKKLEEFVNKYSHKHRDHGMALLATAYHEDKQHKKSIETLLKFQETYPTSKYLAPAMLNGGNWSVPMAYEENAIFFYTEYIKAITPPAAEKAVLNTLTELYVGRRLYSEAIANMDLQLKSPKYSSQEKEDMLIRQIDLEFEFGSKQKALDMINKTLALNITTSSKSIILGTKARLSKVTDIAKIEQSLLQMNRTPIIDESIGEIRFVLGNASVAGLLEPINSINLKDPTATLNQRKSQYDAVRAKLRSACSEGVSSYCVPAMHRSARISEEFIEIIESINIVPTLEEKIVQQFENRKTKVLDEVTQNIISDDEQAWARIPQGNTLPEWTQQIYWQNSSDINFENLTGEGGEAYIQWPVSAN